MITDLPNFIGTSLNTCINGVKEKNKRLLCIAVALGLFGLGLLSLAVADKIRRAKARRRAPLLARPKSLSSLEQMTERGPTAPGGATDGWTNWFFHRRDTTVSPIRLFERSNPHSGTPEFKRLVALGDWRPNPLTTFGLFKLFDRLKADLSATRINHIYHLLLGLMLPAYHH
jgi:hypothetical protein